MVPLDSERFKLVKYMCFCPIRYLVVSTGDPKVEPRLETEAKNHGNGSFYFKSPRGGRGHGPDFAHIQYLITIRYTKTKSEVLGQIMTKFSKKWGVEFFVQEWQPWSQIYTILVLCQFYDS